MFNHLNLIDLSTISNSSSAPIKTSFNRNQNGGNGEIDMQTGLTGEQLVYEYLLNKYHDQLDSVSIEWLNKNKETSFPYDIILTENGIKYYIEVKATRSNNQHTFFLSINQMKAILEHGDNYYIYRVYLKQKKLIILNNIESCLKDRNQLALLLTMNPKSLDQAIFTDE
jgi:Holliday junction resolvase-like predicted endonuclease